LAELEEIFQLCDEEGIRTRIAADFFPHVHSRLYLDRFGAEPMLTFTATPHDEIRLFLKRVFDVTLALGSLAIVSVPMMLLVLLVRVTSHGPAIFHQVRCGLNGRRFTVYKLRSMVNNAHERQAEVAHLNEKDGPVFKSSRDPRLTPIGRYLRRFSIDEWPQFWNILKGDMSFVGPRPAVPGEVEQYKAWQRRRLRMRPGLTCLWAIRGRDAIDFDTWMKLDLEYIDNWSLAPDLKILLRSIPRVLAGKGAN
jgi:exopolysaccharide biosynthesis polyprenyl glycosylphosphotransferase